MDAGGQNWLVRLSGKTSDPAVVANLPIPGVDGEIPLSRVASVQRAREKPAEEVRLDGEPSILLAIMKQDNTNIIDLVEPHQSIC